MPFTAHDLRYKAEQTYPALYAHLSRHAQRFLGSLKYDSNELDLVVGHVIEQLVRLGLLGGEDKTPLTALDQLTTAQFYAFLNRSIRNKAIDRLRKYRAQTMTMAELEPVDASSGEEDLLNEVVETIWGPPPFATPEEATLQLASQQALRNVLKHCLKTLSAAPRQLQAIIHEMDEFGATELLHSVVEELRTQDPHALEDLSLAHISQHKDHAHKKLRHCLQQQSSNLTVMIALRLTEYGVRSTDSQESVVDIQTLAQDDLSPGEVRTGLNELVIEGYLDWHGTTTVHLTAQQMKRLQRFYQEP
jgi:DNA-directed RNA polymerase specialized sigma24 family protein